MPYISLRSACVDYPVPMTRTASSSTPRVGGHFFERDGRRFVRAMDGVDLQLRKGTRLGLLGGNGSGKSTLLRTLAGILPLSRGGRTIDGTVTTVFNLNVGVELDRTGAENIDRLAALHNIPRQQIPALMEEVAEFSELGDFLFLPMKNYSAGMRARLVFAVTTNLNANIILMDENIGVGDKTFQDKARKRVERFLAQDGIAVVASHANSVLRNLCTTGLVMQSGRVAFHGEIDQAIAVYGEMQNGVAQGS